MIKISPYCGSILLALLLLAPISARAQALGMPGITYNGSKREKDICERQNQFRPECANDLRAFMAAENFGYVENFKSYCLSFFDLLQKQDTAIKQTKIGCDSVNSEAYGIAGKLSTGRGKAGLEDLTASADVSAKSLGKCSATLKENVAVLDKMDAKLSEQITGADKTAKMLLLKLQGSQKGSTNGATNPKTSLPPDQWNACTSGVFSDLQDVSARYKLGMKQVILDTKTTADEAATEYGDLSEKLLRSSALNAELAKRFKSIPAAPKAAPPAKLPEATEESPPQSIPYVDPDTLHI